jgi:hypothetical protein
MFVSETMQMTQTHISKRNTGANDAEHASYGRQQLRDGCGLVHVMLRRMPRWVPQPVLR